MKHLLTFVFIISAASGFSQGLISSTNSGAYSGSSLSYSVGEIFVVPTVNSNEANSGTIGVLSRLEFIILGTTAISDQQNVKVYPNPVANTLFFETTKPVSSIYVFSVDGKLVGTYTISNSRVDLTNLQSGTYLIATSLQKNQSFKIVKQ